jgi:uncharacterized protein
VTWAAEEPQQWDGKVAIILAHGAGQDSSSPFMRFFHGELALRGLLSITFNFDYMERGRKFPDPQPKLQATYRAVVTEVLHKYRPRTMIIGGKSMGGRVASYIAADMSMDGLVFLGYPLHPPGKFENLRDAHLDQIEAPMLFLSGTRDPFARTDLLEAVVKRLGERASLIWTPGGDHSLKVGRTAGNSLNAAAETIEAWIHRMF